MNLILKDYPDEFCNFLSEKINLELFQYKYLKDEIIKVRKGESQIYGSSIINATNTGWILILHCKMLLIYGQNWGNEQIQEISEEFNLNHYTNFTLAGEDELIDAIINFYNPKNFHTWKRRLFYQTEKIKVFDNTNGKIELGNIIQSHELAVMLQEYYHEEYDGLNDKEISDMQNRVNSMIMRKLIYVHINAEDKITCFCSVVDPDIGILFTKKEHRNQGYGKIILSYCADLLQQKNGSVFLMTDRDNPESNEVCNNVGFVPYFEYKMTTINLSETLK